MVTIFNNYINTGPFSILYNVLGASGGGGRGRMPNWGAVDMRSVRRFPLVIIIMITYVQYKHIMVRVCTCRFRKYSWLSNWCKIHPVWVMENFRSDLHYNCIWSGRHRQIHFLDHTTRWPHTASCIRSSRKGAQLHYCRVVNVNHSSLITLSQSKCPSHYFAFQLGHFLTVTTGQRQASDGTYWYVLLQITMDNRRMYFTD